MSYDQSLLQILVHMYQRETREEVESPLARTPVPLTSEIYYFCPRAKINTSQLTGHLSKLA